MFFSESYIQAQKKHQFDHLSISDGLLANNVFALYEDNQGYLWIGSAGGLQRYDGYSFVNYTYNPKAGMLESTVRHIIETSKGEIWAGLIGGGVIRVSNGKLLPPFIHDKGEINSLSGNDVESLIEDKNGGIWIATNGGLDYYLNGQFLHFTHDPLDSTSISNNTLYSLHLDTQGQLWVGTQVGLNLYLGNGKFRRFYHNTKDNNTISGNFIHGVTSDDQGDIWLAIVQGGVSKINIEDYSIERYQYDPDDDASLGNDIALDIKAESGKAALFG